MSTSAKINVLMISSRSDIGGGPKHMLDILKYNSLHHKKTNKILYAAIPYNHDLSNLIIENAKDSLHIPHRSFSAISFIKILKFCKKNKIKILHSHGRGAGYYSRLLKPFGFKVIHTLHGVHVEDNLKNRFKLAIDRLLVPLTDQFICVSKGEKTKAILYKVINEKKTIVIFNGVHVHLPLRSMTPIDPKNIVRFGLLGRLSFAKGYDILIPYIDKLLINYPELKIKIQIAGEGEDRNYLLNLLSKHEKAKQVIFFKGKTSDPITFLKSIDIFMSFSRFEGMPISVLEALSTGTPCLVSNVVGNNDIITQHNGFLFDLDSYESFQKQLISILKSSHIDTTEQGKKDILEKFNNSVQIPKTIDLY